MSRFNLLILPLGLLVACSTPNNSLKTNSTGVLSYDCKINTEQNYAGGELYINKAGKSYFLAAYNDARYDSMEYVYDLAKCEKISSGVASKSRTEHVLTKNHFRQMKKKNDLSPWLTHKYKMENYDDKVVFKIQALPAAHTKSLENIKLFFAGKIPMLSAEEEGLLTSPYLSTEEYASQLKQSFAKLPSNNINYVQLYYQANKADKKLKTEFAQEIAKRYLASSAFVSLAEKIQSLLLTAPNELRALPEYHLVVVNSNRFLLRAKEHQDRFEIDLEPSGIKISKNVKITIPKECKDTKGRPYRNDYDDVDGSKYQRTQVDITTTCTVQGEKHSDGLKSRLITSANTLGFSYRINFDYGNLGDATRTELVSEKLVGVDQAKRQQYKLDQIHSQQCSNQKNMCLAQCELLGWGSTEGMRRLDCERKCNRIYC